MPPPSPSAAAAAEAPPTLLFVCVAPSPGRRRVMDDGRNAVGGGPVEAAGAGAGARWGGGLNGSTLMVEPQHTLQVRVIEYSFEMAEHVWYVPAMQLQCSCRCFLALIFNLSKNHTPSHACQALHSTATCARPRREPSSRVRRRCAQVKTNGNSPSHMQPNHACMQRTTFVMAPQ
jgi:hypothetical protein